MDTRLNDEINEQEFMTYYTKPIIVILTIVIAICLRSIWIVFAYFAVLFCFKFAFWFLTVLHSKKKENEQYKLQLSSHRTLVLEAIITQIIADEEVDYDYVQVICEYSYLDSTKKTFKSAKVVGKTQCKKGDMITVMVEPGNYDNYEVKIEDILQG